MNNNIVNDINEENENIIIESRYNSGTTLNDIIEITINNDIFINNITNNIIVNRFSLEDLDDITVSQFISLFTNNLNNQYKFL